MGLEAVVVPVSQFDTLYDHIVSHRPTPRGVEHRNMHLRSACQRGGERALRYLHAMRVRPGEDRVIEGMLSGPGVLWGYELIRLPMKTQLVVSVDEADAKARDRIERQFLKEIMNRVREEQAGGEHYNGGTLGQLYMRRRRPSMSVSHSVCQDAVKAGLVDLRFVSRVLPWGFRLLWGTSKKSP